MDKGEAPLSTASSQRKTVTPKLRRGSGSVHSSVAEAIGMRIVRGEFAPGSILPNETK